MGYLQEEIERLEKILNGGMTSHSVEGQSVNYDLAAIRRRLRELREQYAEHNPLAQVKRPRTGRINLSGF